MGGFTILKEDENEGEHQDESESEDERGRGKFCHTIMREEGR